MSVLLNILDDGEGMEYLFFGTVHGKEIIQARNESYASSFRTANYKYQIFNNLECTEYNVTADDIAAIAALDIEASVINPKIVMAVIESKYLRFSLTKSWQAYVEDYISHIKSFRDRDSALSWICSTA